MLRKETTILLIILAAEVLVGSATGVQRTVLSVAMSEAAGKLSALLPLISFGAFKAAADLTAGFASHRMGRKASLVLGASVYFGGALVILLLGPPLNFLLGNILVGAGEGVFFATAAIAVSDLLGLERASLSFGYIESACYFGYAVGAYVGGLLWSPADPRLTYTYIALSAGTGLALALSSRETKHYSEPDRKLYSVAPEPREALKLVVTNPSTLSALIAAHMAKVADSIVWGVIPLYVQSRGLSVYYAGYAQSLLLLVWSATMPLWSSYSDRAGRRLVSTLGLMLTAFTLIALPSARTAPEILLIAMALGIGYAMYYPVLPAPISDMSPPALRDVSVGFYRLMRDSGYATGAIIGSILLGEAEGGYSSVFTNVGVLLAVTAAVYSVFFRETRPTWPFFDLVVRHLEIISEIMSTQEEVIRDIFAGRVGEAQFKAAKVKELEREADAVKRELMWRIWSGLLPTSSRMDFERLVEEIDKVAGAVIECNERLVWVKYNSELAKIEPIILEMVRETEKLSKKLTENLQLLRLSPAYAVNVTLEIDAGERRVDALRAEAMREIRRLIEEGRVDLMSALNLIEAVNLIELVSDDFQDAADIIRIIAYKHAAVPPEKLGRARG